MHPPPESTYVLHVAPPAFGVPNASPFATKAESLLRLSGLRFESVPTNPTTGPRKKIPFLVCPDGEVIADTQNIYAYLVAQAGLDLPALPQHTPVRRLVEEHLYWVQVAFRWEHHPDQVRDQLFGEIPQPVRSLVFAWVRRQVRRDLWGQGLGRRPAAEILELVEQDLDALEVALGDRACFGGDRPCLTDLSVHGLMDQILPSTLDDGFAQAVRRRAPMAAHHQRVDRLVRHDEKRSTPCSTRS